MCLVTRIKTLLILRLGVAGSLCSLGALLSSEHLVFDLVSHFRVQYIVLIIIVISIALFARKFLITGLLAVCLFVHVVAVYQSVKPRDKGTVNQSATLNIMSSNLLASNDDFDAHTEFIASVNPDVIVFQEYTTAWHTALNASLDGYPFRLTVPMDNPFGIALYSKLPLADEKVVTLLDKGRPSVEAVVSRGERSVTLFGTHPPPPLSFKLYKTRNQHLRKLSERVLAQSGSTIVIGDLNISPWSKHFSDFLGKAELTDARRGQGLLPTWPAGLTPLLIPIDHIVVGKSVRVVSMKTSRGLSSDHRAIWANVAF